MESFTPTRSPMPVAFVAGQLCVGGAEQQLYLLLSGLNRTSFSPIVISLGPNPNEYWTEHIRALGIPVWHLSPFFGRVGRTFRIAALLRSTNVQIVHGWVLHTNPYSAIAGRLAGVPIRLGSIRGNYKGMPTSILLRWTAFRGLDALVTNSNVVALEVKDRQLTKARVEAVLNGVKARDEVGQTEYNILRSELGFSSTDVVIGSIGRMDRNKNHAMMLRVFAKLSRKWDAIKLIIIGDGPLKNQLASIADSLGIAEKVCLPGEKPLAAKYLSVMDVCCFTSLAEGLPNVIMEASAAGLPVVATKCGGIVELIEEGTTGFLVPVDDDIGMAKQLEALLSDSDLRYRMGASGRNKMIQEFSVQVMVDRMTELYESLIATKIYK